MMLRCCRKDGWDRGGDAIDHLRCFGTVVSSNAASLPKEIYGTARSVWHRDAAKVAAPRGRAALTVGRGKQAGLRQRHTKRTMHSVF
jgi:hypothetical protein